MNPLYPHPVSTLFSVISLFQSSTPLSPHLPSSLEGRKALGTITFPGTLFTTYRVCTRATDSNPCQRIHLLFIFPSGELSEGCVC